MWASNDNENYIMGIEGSLCRIRFRSDELVSAGLWRFSSSQEMTEREPSVNKGKKKKTVRTYTHTQWNYVGRAGRDAQYYETTHTNFIIINRWINKLHWHRGCRPFVEKSGWLAPLIDLFHSRHFLISQSQKYSAVINSFNDGSTLFKDPRAWYWLSWM